MGATTQILRFEAHSDDGCKLVLCCRAALLGQLLLRHSEQLLDSRQDIIQGCVHQRKLEDKIALQECKNDIIWSQMLFLPRSA